MRAQYKINFDHPPRLKKLPEALIISPESRHLYIQTDRHKFSNRLYITRPKRLDTSKRRHAILHVKNSVLPSAAISKLLSCILGGQHSAWTVGGVIAGGVVAVVAAPVVLTTAGFTGAGIAAGSVASSMMSASAIANGGGVVAGGVVATLQSAGAAGLGWAGSAAVGTAGAAVGAAVTK